jgi:trk system potassium uptake protein TrkA
VGQLVRDVPWPVDVVLVAILRDGQIFTPEPARSLESNDELLLVAAEEHEDEIAQLLAPIEHPAPR